MRERFWEFLSLEELTPEEWEALCDGCGRCCMVKLEDEDTAELWYTDVVCRYLDSGTCRCTAYAHRHEVVPDCLNVTPAMARKTGWLPESCAYRRLAEGRGLASWHPLLSGSRATVVEAGVSVRGKVVSEILIPEDAFEERIIHWVR